MFKMFIGGDEYGEKFYIGENEDLFDALEVLAVLEKTMPDSKFWVETSNS